MKELASVAVAGGVTVLAFADVGPGELVNGVVGALLLLAYLITMLPVWVVFHLIVPAASETYVWLWIGLFEVAAIALLVAAVVARHSGRGGRLVVPFAVTVFGFALIAVGAFTVITTGPFVVVAVAPGCATVLCGINLARPLRRSGRGAA